ncbi:MAG: thermonuclease family protein [Kofleriaceae bacterium]|jgi:endonuclease YncB( thermonuclease family)|nr:thermonuclease family protein [Kofleriaceae bacterium]
MSNPVIIAAMAAPTRPTWRWPARLVTAAVLAAALVPAAGCGPGHSARYSRKQAQKSLQKLETPGLLLGEFTLTQVVDGDTVKVDGLDSSLRLIALDCEETFKNDDDKRGVETDWNAYLVNKRGDSKRPVKAATPMGEIAKQFGKQFFADADKVRLERDDAREIRDRYNRYLAYVLVQRRGTWVNYNVEVVRAGMSPYFSKYGYSRRYHQEFVAAEREARAAGRGIWAPTAMSYRDYDERKAWWDARAEFIAAFDRQAEGRTDHFPVTQWDLTRHLEALVGKQVTLLGTVGEVKIGDRGPTRVLLSRRMFSDFPLVFFDKDALVASGLIGWRGEFIAVTGVVTEYENRHNHKKTLQIVVDRPSQITLSPIPGLTLPAPVGDAAAPSASAEAAPGSTAPGGAP